MIEPSIMVLTPVKVPLEKEPPAVFNTTPIGSVIKLPPKS